MNELEEFGKRTDELVTLLQAWRERHGLTEEWATFLLIVTVESCPGLTASERAALARIGDAALRRARGR